MRERCSFCRLPQYGSLPLQGISLSKSSGLIASLLLCMCICHSLLLLRCSVLCRQVALHRRIWVLVCQVVRFVVLIAALVAGAVGGKDLPAGQIFPMSFSQRKYLLECAKTRTPESKADQFARKRHRQESTCHVLPYMHTRLLSAIPDQSARKLVVAETYFYRSSGRVAAHIPRGT